MPFLDRGVVDTAHAIRESQLVKGFTSKHILRQAAVGLVPDDIIRRPKVGFGVPLRSWMAGPLAPWMRDQLDPSVIRARGIFDVGGVERLVAANNEGRIDATYTLLSIAFIERWLQLFVDQVPVSPPHSPAAGLSWRTVT